MFEVPTAVNVVLSIPAVVYIFVNLFRIVRYFPGRCRSKRRLDGQTMIVTGGNSDGIGWATAREFARRGGKVILAARTFDEAQLACNRVRGTTWSNGLFVNMKEMELDLTSIKSIRKFVKDFLADNDRLDILVNNAGVMGLPEKEMTADGLEKTMASNYFGHFLLTNLLLDVMRKTNSTSRIINIADDAHKLTDSLDMTNLNSEKYWEPKLLYARSKLATVLFTKELSRRIYEMNHRRDSDDFAEIDVNACNPGLSNTELFRHLNKNKFFQIKHMILKHFYRNPHQGAQTPIYLAVDEDIEGLSGEYWESCDQTQASALSDDAKLAEELWNRSVKAVKLTDEENFFTEKPKPTTSTSTPTPTASTSPTATATASSAS